MTAISAVSIHAPQSPRTISQSALTTRSDRAMEAAQKLEATFLAEMLKSAGFGKEGGFAGGVGEEQFASLHVQALADKVAKAGGLGLAETFYRSMMETTHDT